MAVPSEVITPITLRASKPSNSTSFAIAAVRIARIPANAKIAATEDHTFPTSIKERMVTDAARRAIAFAKLRIALVFVSKDFALMYLSTDSTAVARFPTRSPSPSNGPEITSRAFPIVLRTFKNPANPAIPTAATNRVPQSTPLKVSTILEPISCNVVHKLPRADWIPLIRPCIMF